MTERRAWPWVALVALIAVAFVALFPSRTYLAQRRDLQGAERRLAVLGAESARLAERAAALRTDAEIERLAREQYGLVRPGEEAYAVLPAPVPPPADTTVPTMP